MGIHEDIDEEVAKHIKETVYLVGCFRDRRRLDWLAEHYWEMRLCFDKGGDIREAIDAEMAKED